jgi:hypothetical protein
MATCSSNHLQQPASTTPCCDAPAQSTSWLSGLLTIYSNQLLLLFVVMLLLSLLVRYLIDCNQLLLPFVVIVMLMLSLLVGYLLF